MKQWFNNIKDKIIIFFDSLFYGMKTTEDSILRQSGITTTNGTTITKDITVEKTTNQPLFQLYQWFLYFLA